MRKPKKPTALHRLAACVLAAALALACAASAYAANGFSDVAEGHWALQYISKAQEAGIVNGYSDGSFRPSQGISRQETVTMLWRTLKAVFPDFDSADHSAAHEAEIAAAGAVKGDGSLNWAAQYIAYGFEKGFMSASDFEGASAGAVAPRSLIARWTSLAMGYEQAPLSVLPYSDTSKISPSDFGHIDALYRHGIMMGNTDGSFAPDHSFTRAQMAAVSVRLMEENRRGLSYDLSVAHKYGTVTAVNADRRTIALSCADQTYTLRVSDTAVILLDGAQASFGDLAALNGRKITVSGIAGTDSVIVQTGPRMLTGTVESIEAMKDYSLVKIKTSSGAVACYAVKDASMISLLSAGRSISYISDGALLLETD